MTPTISDWVRQMSDPLFPLRKLDEGLEVDEDDDSEADSEDGGGEEAAQLQVDPLLGWSRRSYVSEGGRRDKNGNLFGKVWISLQSGGEFR